MRSKTHQWRKCILSEKLKQISFKCQERFLEQLHELVRQKIYPSRSEAIRTAIRDLLDRELKQVILKHGESDQGGLILE